MLSKILKSTVASGLLIFAPHGFADRQSDGFYVWADVTSVSPIVTSHYEQIPTTSCKVIRQAPRREYRPRRVENAMPTLFGALVGGVIGNQFGNGNGKRAMTVVGAIAGASIANAGNRERDLDYQPERKVCQTDYEVREYDVVEGYEVSYRYLGREFSRVTENHPGERLKLYVTVDPDPGQLI